MTIGSIVHELLQITLRRRLSTRDEIKAVSEELLSEMTFTLYANQMDIGETRTEIEKFIDKIVDFVQQYIEGNRRNVDKQVFPIEIDTLAKFLSETI